MRVDDLRAWNAACRRAGIEDFRFNDLRHTWASWLIQSGVPLSVLQEMGGWESIEMVRRYAHLAPNHLTEHAKQIDSIFSDDVPNMSHLENKELAERPCRIRHKHITHCFKLIINHSISQRAPFNAPKCFYHHFFDEFFTQICSGLSQCRRIPQFPRFLA